ncbi:tetratricopeptide repeat protein [Pacificimonas sp. WHA3]|uniref:Tetratricopeptide repeat protein n=1 Tax=Pacificimonas pallii TaxID=2827236 RepID=A0ABS6SDD0_9SPHN|nr:tetratricopeptide repeat protein [Pacificimonas pallii]MBV7255857.1 tetratricopeptide repeat protein [Pacificimonas pallii]
MTLAGLAASLFAGAALAQDVVPADAEAAGFCRETLIGTPLRTPDWNVQTARRLNEDIAMARSALDIAPDREESYFWLGRRLGYAGRYCDAINVFTRGLTRFPGSYRLLRYRGRHLARVRQFDLALSDYERAMELMRGEPDSFEPDGLPNARGLTLGTYKSNIIYYHAQTSFAVGDFARMAEGMAQAFTLVPDFARDDMLPPTAFWTYLAYRKMGEDERAKRAVAEVPADLNLTENQDYHRAVKVMQGRITAEDLTESEGSLVRFALAMEHRFAGREDDARRMLRAIVDESPQGFWPAEVELTAPDRAAQR